MFASTTQQVDPQAIESELDRVWAQLYGDAETGSVTRAAMSNLLVFCGDEQQAKNVTGRIAGLVEQHPARVLILALQSDESQGLQARVSVHCRKIGEDRQLCAEHIELHFHATAIERAVSVIRPLLIGDLPTALWWFTSVPPPLMSQVFEGLVGLSQQVIYDSVGWTQPVEGVRAMARWIGNRDTVVFNLAWRRLKSWRRMLTMGLDPEFNPGALDGLNEIEIVHGRDALPLAWLLMAWLAGRLNWQVKSAQYKPHEWIEWMFASRAGQVKLRIQLDKDGPERTIESMQLKWIDNNNQMQQARFCTEGHHLVTDEDYSCIPVISRPQFEFKLEQLVAAQMAHRYHDRLFMQTVEKVADMANALPPSSASEKK
jgi:glucose-6-phosphate dehydrogenase assembly protein OpcA